MFTYGPIPPSLSQPLLIRILVPTTAASAASPSLSLLMASGLTIFSPLLSSRFVTRGPGENLYLSQKATEATAGEKPEKYKRRGNRSSNPIQSDSLTRAPLSFLFTPGENNFQNSWVSHVCRPLRPSLPPHCLCVSPPDLSSLHLTPPPTPSEGIPRRKKEKQRDLCPAVSPN